jgi:hypothetical protein
VAAHLEATAANKSLVRSFVEEIFVYGRMQKSAGFEAIPPRTEWMNQNGKFGFSGSAR